MLQTAIADDSLQRLQAKAEFTEILRNHHHAVSSMSIDDKTAEKIAHLARLKVPAEERQSVASELNKILGWVEQLNAVDVANVEPLANVNDEALRKRKDVINDGGYPKDILANAPSRTADFFTVPKVVE